MFTTIKPPPFAKTALAQAMVASGSRPRCDLRHSIRLTRGHGSPTNARASEKTVADHEGLLKTCLDDEIAIEGARRVYNLVNSDSVPLAASISVSADAAIADATIGGKECTNINWVVGEHDGGTIVDTKGAATYTPDNDAEIRQTCSLYLSRALVSGEEIWFYEKNEGNGTRVTLNETNTSQFVGTWVRITVPIFTSGGAVSKCTWRIASDKPLASVLDFYIAELQAEEVTGQSNTEPSEYVSVGVESDPWHGFGVDGVKYFLHENGNTTSSNIVTEIRGDAIIGTIGKSIEEAGTNLLLQSEDFGTTWINTWSGGTTLTLNAAIAPDGTTTADEIAQIDGTSDGISQESITLAASTAYIVSEYIKNVDSTQSRVTIYDDNASANLAFLEFDWTAGVPSTSSSSGASSIDYELQQDGWYRVSFKFTTAGTVTTHRVILMPERGAAATNSIYAWGADLKAGSQLTSYVPTTTGTATREADDLSMQVEGNFNDAQGSCYVELTPKWNSADISADQYIIGIDSAGSAKLLYIDATNGKIETTDGTNTVADTTALVSGTTYKICLSWFGTTLSLTVDGTTTSGTFVGSWSPDAIYIGNNDGASEINGLIGDLDLYPQAKTDAQMVALTS